MKKILLLALPLMVMCFASCEKNNEEEWTDDSPIIQFKDPKFLEALVAIGDYPLNGGFKPTIDKNADGQISEKEASVATWLHISSSDIRNIDEIKYFSALTELSCYDNQLTTLDLSNNTTLTSLGCGGNQLTSLDLSKNTALTSLGCGGNQLTTLDVSKNTALTHLSCYENQFTSLDLSNNTALTKLWCYDNRLTELDLSKNAALTELECYNNQLTTLDLSNNTALTWLWCYDNRLTSLDLSKNTELKSLECSGNPLQKIILYKYHMLIDSSLESIEKEYGNVIEYVE